MSKQTNLTYILEGQKRAKLRRIIRNEKHHDNQRSRGKKCEHCDGFMSWCSVCQVYSRFCCVDYGTCQCS